MEDKFRAIFNLVKKDDEDVLVGDDIHIGSMAPYGISSGIPELDLYLGRRGGLPASKIIEFYGKQMVGKTTAALQAAAEWQKRGGLVVFIDTEKSYDIPRAQELGINTKNLFWHPANSIEEIFTILTKYIGEIEIDKGKRKSKGGVLSELPAETPVLFIVDSITGVGSEADAQNDIAESDRPGFEAKQIKRGLKRLNPLLSELDCKPSVIFINHAVTKIGGWGKQTDSGGGLAIKFYASVRVEFTHTGNMKEGDVRTGQEVKITIEKLKGGHLTEPTFTGYLTNERGFDKYESLKEVMIKTNFASRPANSKILTILPESESPVQIKNTEFKQWCDEKGYEEVLMTWRRYAIENGFMTPWGTA